VCVCVCLGVFIRLGALMSVYSYVYDCVRVWACVCVGVLMRLGAFMSVYSYVHEYVCVGVGAFMSVI